MTCYTDINLKNLSFQAGLEYTSLNKIRDRKRAHYEPGPNIMVNSSTGFIETEFVSELVDASVVQCERKTEKNRISSMLGPMGSVSTDLDSQNSHQQPSPTTSKISAIVANESSPHKAKRST